MDMPLPAGQPESHGAHAEAPSELQTAANRGADMEAERSPKAAGEGTLAGDEGEQQDHYPMEVSLADVLREMYITVVLNPSGLFQAEMERRKTATSLAVLQNARPLEALGSSTCGKTLLFIASIIVLVNLVLWLTSISNIGFHGGNRFRFSALELRGGSGVRDVEGGTEAIAPLHIGRFGVLVNGCVAKYGEPDDSDPFFRTLVFNKSMRADGWFFTTSQADAAQDPVRFAVEHSNERVVQDTDDRHADRREGEGHGKRRHGLEDGEVREEEEWVLMGGTRASYRQGTGDMFVTTDSIFATPRGRGKEVLFSYRCGGLCQIKLIGLSACFFGGCAGGLLLVLLKMESKAVICFRLMCFGAVVGNVLLAIFSPPSEGLCPLVQGVQRAGNWTWIGLFFGRTKRVPLDGVLLLTGVWAGSFEVIKVVMGSCGNASDDLLHYTFIIMGVCILVFMAYLRFSTFFSARGKVSSDRRAYNDAWELVLHREEVALNELGRMALRMARRAKGPARQVRRRVYEEMHGLVTAKQGDRDRDRQGKEARNRHQVVEGVGERGTGGEGTDQNLQSWALRDFGLATMDGVTTFDANTRAVETSTNFDAGSCQSPASRKTEDAGGGTISGQSASRSFLDELADNESIDIRNVGRDEDRRKEGSRSNKSGLACLEHMWLSLFTRKSRFISSLDQLYVQAIGMDPVLRAKVQAWALASNGTFRQARLKSVAQATEKLLHTYKEDVSRLLDLCRHSIVFDSVRDIHLCLFHLATDQEVQLVRIKNRLDPNYDSWSTAGYRDVSLILRIQTDDTVKLGIHTHCVEVLLVLSSFVQVMTKDSHARYREFRSLRQIMGPSSILAPLGHLANRLSSGTRGGKTSSHGSSSPTASKVHPAAESATLGGDESASHAAHVPLGTVSSTFMQPQTTMLHPGAWRYRRPSLGSGVSGFTNAFTSSLRNSEVFLPSNVEEQRLPEKMRSLLQSPSAMPRSNSEGGDSIGVAEPQQDMMLFETWFRILATYPGSYLDKKLGVVSEAIGDNSADTALFTSRPLQVALLYRRYRFCLLFLALSMLLFNVPYMKVKYHYRLVFGTPTRLDADPLPGPYHRFKFTALGLRSGSSENITSPHIGSFDILQHGCPILVNPASVESKGPSMVISYTSPPAFEGVRITTSKSGDPNDDPVSWLVQAQAHEGGEWLDAASSNVRWQRFTGREEQSSSWEVETFGGTPIYDWLPNLPFEVFAMPLERDASIDVDMRTPTWLVLIASSQTFVASLGIFCVLILSRLGITKHCSSVLSATCVTCALCCYLAAFKLVTSPLQTTKLVGIYYALYGLMILLYSVVVVRWEYLLIQVSVFAGAYLWFLEFLFRVVLDEQQRCVHDLCNFPVTASVLLVGGMVLLGLKLRSRRIAHKLIMNDCATYDKLWEKIVEESWRDINEVLLPLVAAFQHPPEYEARQYNRKKGVPLTDLELDSGDGSESQSFLFDGIASSGSSLNRAGTSSAIRAFGLEVELEGSQRVISSENGVDPNKTGSEPQSPDDSRSSPTGASWLSFRSGGSSPTNKMKSGSFSRTSRTRSGSSVPKAKTRSQSKSSSFYRPGEAVKAAGASQTGLPEDLLSRPGEGSVFAESGAPSARERDASLSPRGRIGRVKQMVSNKLSITKSGAGQAEGNSRVDYGSRVMSLDQLFAQATGLDPILRTKVQQWALASKGYFRGPDLEGKPSFVLWQDAVASPEMQRSIRWGKLKSVRRSVEKLLRSYTEDVSRLLDVCRQSIVFDTIADIAKCLEAILSDPEIQVVRLRNRQDPSYDSMQSAGYRDVSLNIRISTPESAGLGLDTHVCEVLLLVRDFAELKNLAGHKRYISFRNRRGE